MPDSLGRRVWRERLVHDVYMYWCTDVSHAHLNVPIHLTVNGICHMKGTLWWFSKIDEATELMDSPDHRLWSTPTEVCRSFLPYLGVASPLSVGTRWVECRRRSDLTLSSSASSLSILEVRLVMVLRERDTWKIKWGGQRKWVGRERREGGREGEVGVWSQHHKTYSQQQHACTWYPTLCLQCLLFQLLGHCSSFCRELLYGL